MKFRFCREGEQLLAVSLSQIRRKLRGYMLALARNKKNQNSCIYGQEDFCVTTLLGSYVSFVKDNALSAWVPDCLYPTCTTPGLCMSSNELLKTESCRKSTYVA